MKQSKKSIILLAVVAFLASCNFISDNTTKPAFGKASPTSLEYRNELATKLKANPAAYTYVFNKYIQENENEYLDVIVRGNDLEASLMLLVTNWNKIEGIKRTKGLGYSGAELKGLKMEIQQVDSRAVFIYNDLEKIVD